MIVLEQPIKNAQVDSESTPLPTVGELVRYIARALDIKNTNKVLDTFAQDADFNWLNEDNVIKKGILDPLEENVSADFSNWFEPFVEKLVADYKALLLITNVDALGREDIMPCLIHEYFATRIFYLLDNACEKFALPFGRFVAYDQNAKAIDLVIKSFSPQPAFIENVRKSYADSSPKAASGTNTRQHRLEQFDDWLACKNTPNLTSLKLLANTIINIAPTNKANIMPCLILARAIDWLRKEMREHQLTLDLSSLNKIRDKHNVQASLEQLNAEKSPLTIEVKPSIYPLFLKLKSYKQAKQAGDLEAFKQALIEFQHLNFYRTQFWADLFHARFYVMQGKPETAIKFYEHAFKRSHYRAGATQKSILAELLATAAYLKDKPCLKKHKAWGLAFKIYPEDKFGTLPVEGWEIKQLRNYFFELFPKQCIFQEAGKHYQHPNMVTSSELICTLDIESQPLNLRSPNTKIVVGSKKMPQLIAHVLFGNFDNVTKLLKAGADVNLLDVASGSSSALLQALECANECYQPQNITCVIELLKHPHEVATLNRLTETKILSVLFEAIRLGKPDIVASILEMGADANLRAEIDNQSPLAFCIQQLYILNTKNFFHKLPAEKVSQKKLARITSRFASQMFEGESQQPTMQKLGNTHPEKWKKIADSMEKDHRTKHTEGSLYEIAELLLLKGADPNSGNLDNGGMTPLMYAAEVGHAGMFELLIKHNGQPDKPDYNGGNTRGYITGYSNSHLLKYC